MPPVAAPAFPSESEFFEVPCYDLTQRGFSFFVANWPAFDSLVVEFDVPPTKVYAAAEVVRCRQVLVYPPDAGQPLGSWSLQRRDGSTAESGLPGSSSAAALPSGWCGSSTAILD